MTRDKVGLGRRGEALAADALVARGFRLVTSNWHCPKGEVDIVMEREGAFYFFEVRTRRGTRYGVPEESISRRKRERMEAVARWYLGEQVEALDVAWHLGVIAVAMSPQGELLRITAYPDLDGEPWELLR